MLVYDASVAVAQALGTEARTRSALGGSGGARVGSTPLHEESTKENSTTRMTIERSAIIVRPEEQVHDVGSVATTLAITSSE